MVTTRKRAQTQNSTANTEKETNNEGKNGEVSGYESFRERTMATTRKRAQTQKGTTNTEKEITNEGKNGEVSGYEQFRDQRIKENMQRLQKLGILDLSRKLKSEFVPPKRPTRNPSDNKSPLRHSEPPRRSSRLKSMTPVCYTEVHTSKKGKSAEDEEIHIPEGSKPEIYTEEHDKLLGDCKTSWTFFVDGYGEDGKRIYDQVKGKTCHQCRQKTLGRHTHCRKCNLVQGQFCGDCLFMRYGENVTEANQNLSWICPVCRGICNCSLCRKAKGWAPTGLIYRKVSRRGFKSVAHYLIQTHRSQTSQEEPAEENQVSEKRSPSFADTEAKSLHNGSLDSENSPDGILKPKSEDGKDDEMEEKKEDDVNAAYDKCDDKYDDGDYDSAGNELNDQKEDKGKQDVNISGSEIDSKSSM